MKTLSKFLPISSLNPHKSLHPSFSSIFSTQPTPKSSPNPTFPNTSHASNDQNLTDSQPPISQNHQNNANSQIPISGNHQNLTEALLGFKEEPFLAWRHYKAAMKQPGFDGKLESFCVLVHILVGWKDQWKVVYKWVSSEHFPNAAIVVDCLVESAERYGFEVDARVFNYLLSGYVRARRIDDAIVCLNWMVENKIDLWVLFVNNLLKLLVRRNMIKEAREVYDKMSSSSVGMFGNSETVRVMIRGCLREGRSNDNALEAERLFRQARENGVKLDAAAYSSAIGAVGKNFGCDLLREMKEKGWTPSQGTFANLIKACVKKGDMVEALWVKEEMTRCGIPMNNIVATWLIKGYCEKGDLESALGVFKLVTEEGLCPDKIIFAALIDGCCMVAKGGYIEKAHELYDRMIGMGVEPSAYNLNSLIKGYLNAHKLEEAYKQFSKAVELGIADIFSYNLMISGIRKLGKVGEAQKLWDQMVESGIRPSIVSYNHLVHCYCKEGDMVMAEKLLTEMISKGFKPNVVTFTVIIHGYFEKGDVKRAFHVFDEMVKQGVVCNDYTYHTIIGGLCKHGLTSQAKTMLENIISEGHFSPTCKAYNVIIGGYIKEGDLDSALSVYYELQQKQILPNIVTFTLLIDGFCKNNNIHRALQMRKEMIAKGFELDITAYGALIDGFCKRRDMESASKIFSELLEAGLSPNAFIYNSMISCYGKLQNMEAALSLHKRMTKEQGIPCDLETYTSLINGLLKEGKLLSASELYSEMLSKGIRPDVITYTVLMGGLCRKGQLENAQELLKEMDEKGLAPNSLIYNALIAGHFREGNLPEAFRLHDEMLDRGLVPDKMTFDFLMNGNFKNASSSAFA